MKRGIYWRAKVVSICCALYFLLPHLSLSQQSNPSTFSIHCDNSTFKELVELLSTKTGLNFIYSSNNLDLGGPISVSVRGNTVEELLSKVTASIGLTFFIDDKHVIIKQEAKKQMLVESGAVEQIEVSPTAQEDKPGLNRTQAEVLAKASPRVPLEYYLSYPQIDEPLQSGFQQYPRFFKERREWMKKLNLGFSLLTSDIGTGVEIAPGYGPVHLLIQPSWQHSDGFALAYGAGATLPEFLGFHLTFNYLYARINYQEPFFLEEFEADASSMYKASRMELMKQQSDTNGNVDLGRYSPRSSVNIHRHQANILFNYHFSERVKLQLGPTFNYAMTTRWVDNWQTVFSSTGDYIQSSRRGGYPAPPPAFPVHEQQGIRDFASSFEREKVSNFWVGWRAGIIYRLDLFDARP